MKRRILLYLALAMALGGALFLGACAGGGAENGERADGLIITNTVLGTGAEAKVGDTLAVHYIGSFEDGTVFESSYDGGVPIEFALGTGRVIKGWDEGIVGMQVGGKRTLVIPPALGYGDTDYGSIPGGSTLVFEVELMDIK
ncbi:MAG: FKBP-type peptidyl-prolyl cis-trans isomerase [Coriobacteriales bacterium]|nr:FKBP-type peptidyl-prolyl cis-trans isomerase [Coriobacteriales bacterium]